MSVLVSSTTDIRICWKTFLRMYFNGVPQVTERQCVAVAAAAASAGARAAAGETAAGAAAAAAAAAGAIEVSQRHMDLSDACAVCVAVHLQQMAAACYG